MRSDLCCFSLTKILLVTGVTGSWKPPLTYQARIWLNHSIKKLNHLMIYANDSNSKIRKFKGPKNKVCLHLSVRGGLTVNKQVKYEYHSLETVQILAIVGFFLSIHLVNSNESLVDEIISFPLIGPMLTKICAGNSFPPVSYEN